MTRKGNNKFIEKQTRKRRENDGGSVAKVEYNGGERDKMEVKYWRKCNNKDMITNEEKLKVREMIVNRLMTWHNEIVEKLIVKLLLLNSM